MEKSALKYHVLIYPYPETGGTPVSSLEAEITENVEDVRRELERWRQAISNYKKPAEDGPAEMQTFRICDGLGEDVSAFCSEADILSSLMWWLSAEPGVTVRELRYHGTVYTDGTLSRVQVPSGNPEMIVQLQAKREGRDAAVYFAGPRVDDNVDDLKMDYAAEFDMEGEEDPNAPSYEDYIEDNLVYDLSSVRSCGVIEGLERRIYVGTSLSKRTEIFWDPCWSDEGSWELKENKVEFSTPIHMFLETDGTDLTFSALLDGRLYQKISCDAEKVIFYYTPLDPAARSSDSFRQGENPQDLIFRRIDGEYQYAGGDSGYAGFTFVPPEIPASDTLDLKTGRQLYLDFCRALSIAAATVKKFRNSLGVFQRSEQEEGKFCTETEHFLLTGDTFRKLLLLVGRQTKFRVSLPEELTFIDWKENYTESVLYDDFFIESLAFTDEKTGSRITLSPEDGYMSERRHPEAHEDDEDPPMIKVWIPSVLKVLIADAQGNERYRGDFSELRKGNVFGSVNLPEEIKFSRNCDAVEENFQYYLDIKRAILSYGVRKIINVFTPAEPLSLEEMEGLLYAHGEISDPALTAMAMKMKRQFVRTGEIPNIALVGQAGTGKSAMLARLASIFGKKARIFSPSDLKGAYLGHTEGKVTEKLVETLKAGDIFVIDEAYELMSDRFGREAVALLLPVMSRDRTSLEVKTPYNISIDFKKREIRDGQETISYNPPNFPMIWIAGYEEDIRLMLGQNKGLYRRFQRVVMTTPTPEQLYRVLRQDLNKLEDSLAPQCYEILTRQFQHNREMLIKFFRWASQPQNSRYFANYAGVWTFLNNCVDGIDFTQSEKQITSQMSDIVTSTKRDIQQQLDVVRRMGKQTGYDDSESIPMIFDNKTRFEDLVGCKNQIEYMQSIIDLLIEKNRYDRLHITVPKGALLLGPPGVGKTFIARAMAGELQEQFEDEEKWLEKRLKKGQGDRPEVLPDEEKQYNKRVGFMSLSAPELTTKPVSFIGSVFNKAEEYDVCVIFIDEVDAIAKNRFRNQYYSHFIELIKQMDGVEQRSNVFILAATNAPESLDPAFTRSGRIDKKMEFTLPELEDRKTLAERSIVNRCETLGFTWETDQKGRRKLPKEKEQGIRELAKELAAMTPGCTPGDIENIVNTAFIMYDQAKGTAEREKLEEQLSAKPPRFENLELACLHSYLYESVERMMAGDPHPIGKEAFNTEKNDDGRSATAIHEVGHALVGILCGCEPIEKITTLPRGKMAGYVTPKPKNLMTKQDFENSIRVAMGGRIAEEIVYGEDNISTGASMDIVQATNRAYMMVERWGFTEKFEFMALKQSTAVHLGQSDYTCSEAFRQQSDEAVNALLKRLYQETKEQLADKKELIIALAKKAFDEETMSGAEFLTFYDTIRANLR